MVSPGVNVSPSFRTCTLTEFTAPSSSSIEKFTLEPPSVLVPPVFIASSVTIGRSPFCLISNVLTSPATGVVFPALSVMRTWKSYFVLSVNEVVLMPVIFHVTGVVEVVTVDVTPVISAHVPAGCIR